MSGTRHATGPHGLRIAYDDEGQGVPVVLVHGLGSHRRRWDPLAARLVDAGFRVVRPDLRGFGASEASLEGYTVADLAGDVQAVMDTAQLARFHLVGHSLGGMIAQHIALERADAIETLTLVSTTSHNGRRASLFGSVMAEVSERGYDAAVGDPQVRTRLEGLLAEAFPEAPPPLTLFRRSLSRPDAAQALAWRATVGFSCKDRLGALTMPVMVVHGSDDPLIPAIMGDLIHHAIAGSTLHRLDGVGHHPHRAAEDIFAHLLLDHLATGGTP